MKKADNVAAISAQIRSTSHVRTIGVTFIRVLGLFLSWGYSVLLKLLNLEFHSETFGTNIGSKIEKVLEIEAASSFLHENYV